MGAFSQENERAVPVISLLSEDQCRMIYDAAIEVMQRTGLRIHNDEVLSMLEKAGCEVDNGVAHIPARLVEAALKSAPKKIQLYNREGEPAMRLGHDVSYFGSGVGAPFILDPFDGQKRSFTKRDVEMVALLQDALPNIDFVMALGEISDVTHPALSDIHQFQAMLYNTSKPINFMATSTQSTLDIIEMAATAVGGEDKLREKPFIFLFGCGPTPPLVYERFKLERLLVCADRGIPIVSLAAGGSGGTAPITAVGQLVTMLAELLTAVVIGQLRKEGTPQIIGGMPLTMDMQSTIFSYGAPEFYITNVGINEIIRFLGLPSYSTAAVSDAKLVDEQAAIEATASSFIQLLSRANLIHDTGFIDSAMIGSFDMLVMCDEIVSMARKFVSGIKFDAENLALDVIHDVGPGGNYLATDHTLNHFKESWQPNLLTRDSYEVWSDKGGSEMSQRVNEKVRSILSNHKPIKIDKKSREGIETIIDRRKTLLEKENFVTNSVKSI